MDKIISLSMPNFEGNEKKYVDDAIEQGWDLNWRRIYYKT